MGLGIFALRLLRALLGLWDCKGVEFTGLGRYDSNPLVMEYTLNHIMDLTII